MAATRLLHLSSFISHPLRFRPSSISRLRFPTKTPSLSWPQFYATSSAVPVDGPATAPHPWPEWERFLDKLKSKGFFDRNLSAGDGEEGVAAASDEASMDLHLVKAACLGFARERFDIFKSLSKEDIQTIVERGCPNLYRKAVNSAKRLRAYLRIDEGDVCSACNLRGSCDRAYIISKEDEVARTVDIMRILLSYVVDPLALSGKEKPSEKNIEESARNLLSELFKLSDTIPDPSLPRPATGSSIPKNLAAPRETSWNMSKKFGGAQNVEMKRGDWLCPNCNFLNFARNVRCLQCKEDGPKRVNQGGVEMKLGDWTCPACQFMNFSRNKKCFRCQGQRPKRELNPGDWECPSCEFINFRRNDVCLKCNCDRPEDEGQAMDNVWRRPKNTYEKNSGFRQ